MFEVLKDVGFIGGIVMAGVAIVIFIAEKIPEVVKYYRTVGGRRIAVRGGAGEPELPDVPKGVKLKRLINGLYKVSYRDKDGNKKEEEVNYESLPALFQKIRADLNEEEPVTDDLNDYEDEPTDDMPGYKEKPTEVGLKASASQNGEVVTEILEIKTSSSFEDDKTEPLDKSGDYSGGDMPTEELTDKTKVARYAESIAEASATEVLPDMRIDEKTEYLK